jgi:hypothetical protein
MLLNNIPLQKDIILHTLVVEAEEPDMYVKIARIARLLVRIARIAKPLVRIADEIKFKYYILNINLYIIIKLLYINSHNY